MIKIVDDDEINAKLDEDDTRDLVVDALDVVLETTKVISLYFQRLKNRH